MTYPVSERLDANEARRLIAIELLQSVGNNGEIKTMSLDEPVDCMDMCSGRGMPTLAATRHCLRTVRY